MLEQMGKVKAGLEACVVSHSCEKCGYNRPHSKPDGMCLERLMQDALAVINALETENEKREDKA